MGRAWKKLNPSDIFKLHLNLYIFIFLAAFSIYMLFCLVAVMKRTQYYQEKTSFSRTPHSRPSFPCFPACHQNNGPSTEIYGSDKNSCQPNRMNHINQIPKQKWQRMNYEPYSSSSAERSVKGHCPLPRTPPGLVSSSHVFTTSRLRRLPGHLLHKVCYQLLLIISVWNHPFLYGAFTEHSIPSCYFPQKQRNSQHSKHFYVTIPKTWNDLTFSEEQFDKAVAFCHKYTFHFF